MSVTFTIEAIPTGAFQFTCFASGDEVVHPLQAGDYEAAVVEVAAHKLLCDECGAYGAYVEAVMDIDRDLGVNLANSNAIRFIAVLGYAVDLNDLCGSATGEDFLGRVLIALADDVDDSAVADVVTRGAKGATLIEGGTRAGYRTDVLTRLHDLAAEAHRLGRDIHWS